MSFRIFLRRLIHLLPVLLGVSLVTFTIIHLAPGDPAVMMLPSDAPLEEVAALRERLGLNKPLHVQYLQWLSRVVQGDLGDSIYSNQPVIDDILDSFMNTALLTGAAFIFTIIAGVLLGMVAALLRGTIFDRLSMIVAVLGWSMPPFWIGLMLIIIFAVRLGWFPTGGMYDMSKLNKSNADIPIHLVLPALTLGLRHMSYIARLTRSSLLEVLGQDYIRTAKAKGLRSHTILRRHALRNALIPVVTVAGISVGRLLGGAVVVETVFAWPGLGDLIVNGIHARDFPLVQGAILFVAFIYVLVNLLVDMLYTWLDPRIQYA